MGKQNTTREMFIPGPPDLPPAVPIEPIQSIQQSIPVRRGDSLRITSFSSLTVTLAIVVRIQTGKNITQGSFQLSTNGSRAAQNLDIDLTDGQLIGIFIQASSGIAVRGQVFVRANLIFGAIQSGATALATQTLLASYITTNSVIAYPTTPLISSIDGAGFLRAIGPTAGSGTTNQTWTVPGGTRWTIRSMEAFVTTSAVAGNRSLSLQAQVPGPTTIFISQPRTLQAASLTRRYDFGGFSESTAFFVDGLGNNQWWVTLPTVTLNYTGGGGFVTLAVDNPQAGDTLAAVMSLEEWLDV